MFVIAVALAAPALLPVGGAARLPAFSIKHTAALANASAPGAPRNLTATATGETTIRLSWLAPTNGSKNVTDYRIYRGHASGNESYVAHTGNASTRFFDSGLTAGTTYFYRVSAVANATEGPRSNEASATTQHAKRAPSAPRNLTATGETGAISLRWEYPADNGTSPLDAFSVYRGNESGGYAFLANVSVNRTSYDDTGLGVNETWHYVVYARSADGRSPASNDANATTIPPPRPPGAPRNLTATSALPFGEVFLAWEAPDNGTGPLSGYFVYRGNASGAETLDAEVDANTTSYFDQVPNALESYDYVVRAFGPGGVSPPSNEVCSVAGPWEPILSVSTSMPCPRQGETVHPLADQSVSASGGETRLDVLTIDGSPTGDGHYELRARAAGQDLAPVTLLTFADLPRVHADVVDVPAHAEIVRVRAWTVGAPEPDLDLACLGTACVQVPALTNGAGVFVIEVDYSLDGTVGSWFVTVPFPSDSPVTG